MESDSQVQILAMILGKLGHFVNINFLTSKMMLVWGSLSSSNEIMCA